MIHVRVEVVRSINIVTEVKLLKFGVVKMDLTQIKQELDKMKERIKDFRGSL